MTTSGSVSQFLTRGGFAQAIPSPNNFGSSVLAEVVSTIHSLIIPLGFATTDYDAYLPQGAFISSIKLVLTTLFTSGATLEVSSFDPTSAAGSAPTITNLGVAGSSTFSYKVSAQVGGKFGLASAAGTTTTGNAVLSGSNYNNVAITAVTNATQYAVYRTAAPGGYEIGLIGFSPSVSFVDNGTLLAAPNTLVPAAAGDILASHAVDTASSTNIPLTPFLVSPIQSAAGQPNGVQQIVATLTGTTATAGAGYLLVDYINTVTAPKQV